MIIQGMRIPADSSGGGAPSGPAGGQLGGTYPNPTVIAITETGASTALAFGTITDGQFLKRVGLTIVSAAVGTGDVVGPASATDNAVVRFDLTTGKLVQNSVVTIGDTGLISGVLTPVSSGDAANKAYVDAVASGLTLKPAARLKSTVAAGNITLSGLQTLDGVAGAAGNRILLDNQTSAIENGLWLMAVGAWTRPTDFAAGSSAAGAFVFVTEGTANQDTGWVCVTDPPNDVVGTNNLDFTQFSAAGIIDAGNGLSKSGNVLSVLPDGATLSVSASGVRVAAQTANRVLISDASGVLTTDAGLTFNATTDALTVAGRTTTFDVMVTDDDGTTPQFVYSAGNTSIHFGASVTLRSDGGGQLVVSDSATAVDALSATSTGSFGTTVKIGGVTNASEPLVVSASTETGSVIAGPTGTLIHAVATDAQPGFVLVDAQSASGTTNPPTFAGRASRGTLSPGAQAAVQSGDALACFTGYGRGTSAYSSAFRGGLCFFAAETWTNTAQGAYAVINVTPTGGVATAESTRFWGSGRVAIGSTTENTGAKFVVAGTSGNSGLTPSNQQIWAIGVDGSASGIGQECYNNTAAAGPVHYFLRGRGTLAGRSAVQSGHYLGRTQYVGLISAGGSEIGAEMRAVTVQTFSSGNAGTQLSFLTCASGSTTLVEGLRVESTSQVLHAAGTEALPSVSFLTEPDCGLRVQGANAIEMSIAATGRTRWHLDGDLSHLGDVGIGAALGTDPGAKLDVTGAIRVTTSVTLTGRSAITSASSPFTVTTEYIVSADATGGNITINLPAAVTGRIIIVKRTDAAGNTVTIDADAAETIDGATTQLVATLISYTLYGVTGTGWELI